MYISSTFRDLRDHRQAVIDFFQKFPDRFDVFAMENYVAEDITPVDRCLQDVAQCDIYLLVLGNRYGFIPEGSEKSVTELEYETAKKTGKKILAFIADDAAGFPPDTDGNPEQKKQKLTLFKQAVGNNRLMHPERFISPDSLAVQVSESMIKNTLLAYEVVDKRKYCCDRRLQYSEYLKCRTKSQVKVFLIHGQRKELGRNLVNRFLIFTLNTGIDVNRLAYHLTSGLMLNDYESSKTNLVVSILEQDLNISMFTDPDISYLISKIDERPFPTIVIVLEIEFRPDLFRQEEADVLQRFFREFHEAYEKKGTKEVYFFVNIQDNNEDENPVKEMVGGFLQNNKPGDPFTFCLPRLKKENYTVVEQWISAYITGDNNCVNLLMEKYFSSLMEAGFITMSDAETGLQKLLKKISARDSDVCEILNL